jgi:hypothetical protein
MTATGMSGYPPAHTRVDCGGDRHAISWEAGELIALDHDDPEGERELAVLGGTTCACVDVLQAWARHRDDPRLLAVLTRGTGDPVRSELGRGRAGSAATRGRVVGWTAYAPLQTGPPLFGPRPPRQMPGQSKSFQDDAALLAGLGRSLTVRLAATVTARLLDASAADGHPAPVARPALEASLFGRATSALRAWTGQASLELRLTVIEPGEPAILEEDGNSTIRAALPLEWVSKVWGRDLSIVAGRFTVDVVGATATRTTLQTVGSDLDTPSLLTLELG